MMTEGAGSPETLAKQKAPAEQQIIQQNWFETLSSPIQLSVLVSGVFFFFGIHNYLQEAIMSVHNYRYGVMLGYLEVFGVTVCSFLERKYIARETQRRAPLSAYPLLTVCLMSSSSLSNLALNYINFPTKVVFRSCKVSHWTKLWILRTAFYPFFTSDWILIYVFIVSTKSSFRPWWLHL